MPPRFATSHSSPHTFSRKFDYKYPLGLNLAPDSELHKALVQEIKVRAQTSYAIMQQRHAKWKELSDSLTAYISLDDYEKNLKKEDKRKPVSLVVPMTYAISDTLLTYMVAAFLKETSIFKYKGTGPEDQVGAYLLNKVIEQQCIRAKTALSLHTMFRDNFYTGVGVVAPYWHVERGTKYAIEHSMSAGIDGTIRQVKTKSRRKGVIWEGNKLININPFRFLPDPNTSIDRLQDGEFLGWIDSTNYISLLEEEVSQPDTLFNVKYVKEISGKTSITRFKAGDERERDSLVDRTLVEDGGGAHKESRSIDVIYMYINLIPNDWNLSNKTEPEKWLFALAGDEVIIDARPANLDHNLFPAVACASEYDGYSITAISRLEVVSGMQTAINHLYNSHIANVRKAVNDSIVVDPMWINMDDLANPEPGKIIRTRPEMWGRGVGDSFKQLAISDITRNNITDANYTSNVMFQVTGATDALQGVNIQGRERVSAAESQGVMSAALSRLEKIAKIISAMAMQDIGMMMASNTLQFMQEKTYVDILGDYRNELIQDVKVSGNRIVVNPEDLIVNYDIQPFDNTMSVSSYLDSWKDIFTTVMQYGDKVPQLMQNLDVMRIFQHIAKLSGAGNIQDFVIQGGGIAGAQVLPTAEVAAQAQAGNIVPVGGGIQ